MASIYQEYGYRNRREYLVSLAEEYGVTLETVFAAAFTLGPSEDFDGLISCLEDCAMMGGC